MAKVGDRIRYFSLTSGIFTAAVDAVRDNEVVDLAVEGISLRRIARDDARMTPGTWSPSDTPDENCRPGRDRGHEAPKRQQRERLMHKPLDVGE